MPPTCGMGDVRKVQVASAPEPGHGFPEGRLAAAWPMTKDHGATLEHVASASPLSDKVGLDSQAAPT